MHRLQATSIDMNSLMVVFHADAYEVTYAIYRLHYTN